MKRTTILLPARLHDRAKQAAKKRGVSLGQLVRELIEGALERPRPGRELDPIFQKSVYPKDSASTGDGAENHERIFAEEANPK